MKKINLGVIGFNETLQIFANNLKYLNKNNVEVEIVAISNGFNGVENNLGLNLSNNDDIINASNIDIVIVSIEGISESYKIVREALEKGKNVITNNTTLIAAYGEKLYSLAKDKGVLLLFESSVLGGTLIIDNLLNNLSYNKITKIYGVLNSTSNYCLSRMKSTGYNLEQVLEDAIELGYSEKDPELDISGKDSLYRLAVLNFSAFGKWPNITKIKTDSLRVVGNIDITFAHKFGYNIKQLAVCDGDKLSVSPTLLESYSQLGNLDGTLTGVVLESSLSGPIFIANHGNDKGAVASSILMDCAKIINNKNNRVYKKEIACKNIEEKNKIYYLRLPIAGVDKISKSDDIQVMEENVSGEFISYIARSDMEKSDILNFITDDKFNDKTCVLNVFRG